MTRETHCYINYDPGAQAVGESHRKTKKIFFFTAFLCLILSWRHLGSASLPLNFLPYFFFNLPSSFDIQRIVV